MPIIYPKNYSSKLDVKETVVAIKELKDLFETKLGLALNLTRVSAPLFVFPETGLNDNLNGIQRPVSFDIKNINGKEAEIVQSLAKWKRYALKKYDFSNNEGIYTDMNAIRRDDEIDNTHSIYVDQWDWEKIITKEDRNMGTLKDTVKAIYSVFKECEKYINTKYPHINIDLPEELKFINSQELEDKYPLLNPKEREDEICKEYGAVFISQIGHKLKSGNVHDGRAPDYDDWSLNGDILFYYPLLNKSIEFSSMGIRVDDKTLESQLKISKNENRKDLDFHKAILNSSLPQTIGGGLGQSRICMFFLEKAHIGEVQSSVWPKEMILSCKNNGINLL